METLLYILLFLFLDGIIIVYHARKFNIKPWQVKKLIKAWRAEYGGF